MRAPAPALRAALLLLPLAVAWPAAAQLELPDRDADREALQIELKKSPENPLGREERIRTLVEISGLAARVRQIPIAAAQQAVAAIGGMTGQGSTHFAELFADEFDGESILSDVVDALISSYDARAANKLLKWYRSPIGEKIGAASVAAHSPDGQGQLGAFARRNRSKLASRRRGELATRLDTATGASRHRSSVAVGMSLSLTSALNQVLGMKFDASTAAANIHRRLSGSISNEVRIYLLFLTRALSTEDVEKAIAFSESEAARWFRRSSDDAYQRGIAAASSAFETHFSAWLEEQDLSERRSAAQEEGRVYGSARLDQECVTQAFRRDGACEDVVCEASNAAFLRECLGASRPTPRLCEDVPTSGEFLESARWRTKACSRRNRRDRFCHALMTRLETYCLDREPPPEPAPS